MKTQRLDKLLAIELNITRSESKQLLKSKRVAVNGVTVTAADTKCSDSDSVTVDGNRLSARQFVYIMMHKPVGVISASDGKGERSVLDLLPAAMRRKGLFPAGRLDKDTTGFVLLTDDGAFAHRMLSPRRHVAKVYTATLDKPFDDAVRADFERGMTLGDETLLPASLEAIDGDFTKARVVLHQGIYHQVRRMFQKHGITVTALHRDAIGALALDETLQVGEARYLTAEELLLIQK